MVFMSDSEAIRKSLGRTLKEIQAFVDKQSQIPDPNAGFALYVKYTSQTRSPLPNEACSWPADDHFRHAPSIACFGFLVACQSNFSVHLNENWIQQLTALLKKDPFPLDRQSFPFRPIEVLGIVLGAKAVSCTEESVMAPLRNVVQRCRWEANQDGCSKLIYGICEGELGLTGNQHEIEAVSAWSLEYA